MAGDAIVDPGPFQRALPLRIRGRGGVWYLWWGLHGQILTMSASPQTPLKYISDDVESISTSILIDDDEHFSHDITTQRRFAPRVFTIERNDCSRSLEYSETGYWGVLLPVANRVVAVTD
jgi:hypothetical protein